MEINDKYRQNGSEEALLQQRIATLNRILSQALKREKRTVEKRRKEYENAQKADLYREIADTILAMPHLFPKGEKNVTVKNIHTSKQERIRLNPALDSTENARLYYTKAKKAHRAAQITEQKLAESERAIREITDTLQRCKEIDALDQTDPNKENAVAALEVQCRNRGLIGSPSGGKPDNSGHGTPVPFRHLKIDTWDIYIGKNNTQNDELTTRFAKPSDIWLHVAAHAGSHVLIRRGKGTGWPPRQVIEKAAAFAVWFSKAKHTSYAEVHVTEARFVRKRRKAPPGEVIAERCKTVRVTPLSPHESQ
jgi:predicted ribosome quality control (RQC) complex YloA/Tae2 family protein